uniref:Sugar phosphate transporter domain-containing protein n=1 Tax=Meloidogyne floridensis TaxID=298350 RepID=A0A915P005_9BILA
MSLALLTIFCCSLNTIAIEAFTNLTGRSTLSFLTFATFLFMVINGLLNRQIFLRRHIPISLANNWVIGLGVPFPLIIVSRSGTLVANALLTFLLQNRRYSTSRIASILAVTCGITCFTLYSQQPLLNKEENNFGFPILFFGILILFLTMFASAYLGILQENIFAKYGKYPEEMMFICIQSVYRLTSTLNSLQITMLLTLRKFLNIFFSILLFKHKFDWQHYLSTILVLIGTFTFYGGHKKFIEWMRLGRREVIEEEERKEKKI